MLLMLTKLRFQTVMAGPGMGMAFGLPISTAIARMEATAEALRESAEKAPSRSESHGEKLKAAVKRKLPSRREKYRHALCRFFRETSSIER